MRASQKTKDLVIVIPGILGSRLLWAGRPLWGDDSATFLEWVKRHGDDLGRLSLGGDDPALEDLGDGITVDGVVESPLVVGRFLKLGGYAPLVRHLQKTLSLRLGENLQLYAYDWRRDLRITSKRLAVKADGWLRAWRTRSGNAQAKIVLIGHAMGGLVARHYVDVEGGWPSVRRIVTIASPFLGSIAALDVLYFGLDFQTYGLPLHDLTPIARTLTSIYELLPHYPAIRTFAGDLVSPFDMRIPTFEQQKLDRARQFHRDLADHHQRNRVSAGYSAMESTVIAGIGQPTIEEARLLPNGTLSVDSDIYDMEADGDGSIPRFSAEAEDQGGFESHFLYVPQLHGALATDPVVHAHLENLLIDRKVRASAAATPLPRFTIRRTQGGRLRVQADSLSLHLVRPFYKAGQTVELRVAARTAWGLPPDSRSLRVQARVEQLGRLAKKVRPATIRLSPISGRPGWFGGKLKAPAPGTYRVTAGTNDRLLSAFRVSDLFEVY